MKVKKKIPKPTNFGTNLRFLRKLQGMTQANLANEIGLKRNNVTSYEAGMIEPNAINFLNICKYFDIPPQVFLEEIISNETLNEIHNLKNSKIISATKFEIKEFTEKTQEMTKIIDGYKTFYTLKKDAINDKTNSKDELLLYSQLEDILGILEELTVHNWNMIKSIYSSGEEEE